MRHRSRPPATVPAVLVAVALGSLAACSGSDGPAPDPAVRPETSEPGTVRVDGVRTGFSLELPGDPGIVSVDETGTCGTVRYAIAAADLRLVVEAVPTACDEAAENGDPINGDHGTYRTVDDVPEPLDEATVATDLGEATVVEQVYSEFTNEQTDYTEPIAFVALDDPVDPAYPTLVLRGEGDGLTREQLEDALGTLEPPA